MVDAVGAAAVGGLLLLLGLLGGVLKERTPVSEPLVALLAGVLTMGSPSRLSCCPCSC